MPGNAKKSQDPRTWVPMADGRPLMAAIPKRNLGAMADARGSITALADHITARGCKVSRECLGQWISGRRHMPDAQIIAVAAALGVSPLYLLDLTADPREPTAPQAMDDCADLVDNMCLIVTCELEAGRPAEGGRTADEWLAMARQLRAEVIDTPGDHRNLGELAVVAARHYSTTGRPDHLLHQICEAGQTYAKRAASAATRANEG